MAMPRTDFSSIQKAIQDAFDTYWRVKEGKRQSGENEKDRRTSRRYRKDNKNCRRLINRKSTTINQFERFTFPPK